MDKIQAFFQLIKDFINGYIEMIKKLINDMKGIHNDPTVPTDVA